MIRAKNSYATLCWILILFLLFLISCGKAPEEGSYFPETGPKAILQRAMELQSNLNVLSLALEPGYEDLSTLAYFRLGKGAKILSAYVTNGEAGENDVQGQYPNYIAATRRLEAEEAISYLDGDVHFMNFPHIVAARDVSVIRALWEESDLVQKMMDLIDNFKPDIILIAPDRAVQGQSERWEVVKIGLLSALRKMVQESDEKPYWKVTRVIADANQTTGKRFSLDTPDPIFGKTYRQIGSEAAQNYESLTVQLALWEHIREASYEILHPASARVFQDLESGLPARNSRRFLWASSEINKIFNEIPDVNRESNLRRLVSVLDSVNINIYWRNRYAQKDQRALSNWKNSLEQLRCALLDIEVKLDVEADTLTMRQLSRIRIREVKGMGGEGKTTVYFAGLDDSWVVNEWTDKEVPFTTAESYRLLSPSQLDLTTPQGRFGLDQEKVDQELLFFILHVAPIPEKSFHHKSVIKLRFAPKMSREIITPIVRMVPDEKLVIRLINHSRDGVLDTVRVIDEVAESDFFGFRLTHKGAAHIDTLTLNWKGERKEGSYIIPINIGGIEEDNFVARKFDVEVNSEKRIGFIPGVKGSTLEATLRRLSVNATELNIDPNLAKQLQNLDVVVLDRRVLSLKPELMESKADLNRFVEAGGHLVYLAQDPPVWQEKGPWDEIEVVPSQQYDETCLIETDDSHPFLSVPNRFESADWNGWLYLRAYQYIRPGSKDWSIPVRAQDGKNPFVVTRQMGEGRKTYIALALSPQFLNIHSGVFRLFANILSI